MPGPNETWIPSEGSRDAFVARYDALGALRWARGEGSTSVDIAWAVAAAANGDTLVAGDFNSTVTFGEGEPAERTLTAVYSDDMYFARYAPSGSLRWVIQAGGLNDAWGEVGTGIGEAADGSILIGGCFDGTPTFGFGDPNESILFTAGQSDVFVAKYAP